MVGMGATATTAGPAAVVFGAINLPESPALASHISWTILLGGLTTSGPSPRSRSMPARPPARPGRGWRGA